jgi:probable HAF family extracellular repeat protein
MFRSISQKNQIVRGCSTGSAQRKNQRSIIEKSVCPLGLALLCLIVCAARRWLSRRYLQTTTRQRHQASLKTPTAEIATLFGGGRATNINTLGGNVSVANAINASGEIAGWNSFNSATFDPEAFIYSNGVTKTIDSPSVFPSGTEAYGINNAGEVVGTGYLTSASFHAFLYSGGKMTDIGPAGAYQASAIAINNSGQIIGGYYLTSGASGEFLITNGKIPHFLCLPELGALARSPSTTAAKSWAAYF